MIPNPRFQEEPGPSLASPSEGIIRFSNVSKAFGAFRALDGVSLSIAAGERVALIGPSGCGKTTLLRCINALERPDAGELYVHGQALHAHGLDLNRFRAGIGVVFQQYNLFPHLTVLENITLGPVQVNKVTLPEAQAQARQLLRQVGIEEKVRAYPDQLSGGQKQRVAIARALAMGPDILLLDEPTSALDPRMSREVLSAIEQVASQGLTLVMVTHELRYIRHMASRLIVMNAGRIVADGSPAEILQNPDFTHYLDAYLD